MSRRFHRVTDLIHILVVIAWIVRLLLPPASNGAAPSYNLSLFARQNTGGFNYVLPDAQGSVRQVADASEQILLSRVYDPFGNLLSSTGAGSTPLGFAGEWTDTSGLQFLRARYYSPVQGRFLTADPFPGMLRQPASLNPYAYVLNNPVLYTDPSGENPFIAAFLIGGFISAGVNLGAQLYSLQPQSFSQFLHCVNWGSVAVSFGAGAVAGLVGFGVGGLIAGLPLPSLGGAIIEGMVTGSLASGSYTIIENILTPSIGLAGWNEGLSQAMTIGGISGGIAGGAGYGIRQLAANRIQAISPPTNRAGLRSTMSNPPIGMPNPEAHHNLPWDFKDWFAGSKRGLNVNNPRFGRWVVGTPPGRHQNWSKEYSALWQNFKDTNPNADMWQVLAFLRRIKLSGKFP